MLENVSRAAGWGTRPASFFGIVAVECLCFLLNIIDGDFKRARGSQGQRSVIDITFFARQPVGAHYTGSLKGVTYVIIDFPFCRTLA